MRRRDSLICLFAALALLVTAGGCAPAGTLPEQSVSPSPSASPQQTATPPAQPEEVLMVDGQAVPARRFQSALGYSLLFPPEDISIWQWDAGETFGPAATPESYLSVSLLDVSNLNDAVAVLQFEHGVEDEPKGFLFGSQGYAGMRMVLEEDDLTIEYILFQHGQQIYLTERAVCGEQGRANAGLLQAMLDSIVFS